MLVCIELKWANFNVLSKRKSGPFALKQTETNGVWRNIPMALDGEHETLAR
jgi:hypothetical protein